MAEIIFRLPSKIVQYGYVEVKGTPQEFGISGGLEDPNTIGWIYATYMAEYLAGEKKGMDTVLGPQEPAQAPTEGVAKVKPSEIAAEQEKAAEELLKKELGATVVSTEEAPWKQDAPEPKAKPWEKNATAKPAVADIDW